MDILVKHKKNAMMLTMLFVSVSILCYYSGILTDVPFTVFLAVCVSTLGLAMYRPIVACIVLVSVVPLEIVNIAPEMLGIALRPYHMIALCVTCAVGGAVVVRSQKYQQFSWNIFDTIIALFVCAGAVSAVGAHASQEIWMQTMIVGVFGIVYFVIRFFVGGVKEVVALMPVVISSGVVVSVYAIVQNILFAYGYVHKEIMPGRPNATFTEPDWLGVYLVFVCAVCLSYLYYNTVQPHMQKFFSRVVYVALFVVFVALILTVARSAWLGVLSVCCVYCGVLLVQKRYSVCMQHALRIVLLGSGAVCTVVFLHLTAFELDNRVYSAGTGDQEITVSCATHTAQMEVEQIGHIADVAELHRYDCRHINLEDIAREKHAGQHVFTITRDDPNVVARASVYAQTLSAIAARPFTGHGWGQSGNILGTDAAGTPLNASNIFLEIMVSTGIIGTLLFGILIVCTVYYSYRLMRTQQGHVYNSVGLFALLGMVAILVPNMFNAGLLLGFVWVYFGLVAIVAKKV